MAPSLTVQCSTASSAPPGLVGIGITLLRMGVEVYLRPSPSASAILPVLTAHSSALSFLVTAYPLDTNDRLTRSTNEDWSLLLVRTMQPWNEWPHWSGKTGKSICGTFHLTLNDGRCSCGCVGLCCRHCKLLTELHAKSCGTTSTSRHLARVASSSITTIFPHL